VFEKTYHGISPFLYMDFDLIQAAQHLLQTIPIDIKPMWVKGHSTAKVKTIQEELNILADHMVDL
jgi:hypothetical protein